MRTNTKLMFSVKMSKWFFGKGKQKRQFFNFNSRYLSVHPFSFKTLSCQNILTYFILPSLTAHTYTHKFYCFSSSKNNFFSFHFQMVYLKKIIIKFLTHTHVWHFYQNESKKELNEHNRKWVNLQELNWIQMSL